jgi:mRNA interferase RelE/StbE
MGQATEIYAKEFESRFALLPPAIRSRIIQKVRFVGRNLDRFPHERLQGRTEYRLRIGDYRVVYEFGLRRNEISLVTIGHRREVYR